MLLVYIGWKRRWWRSFEESPLASHGGEAWGAEEDDQGDGLEVQSPALDSDAGEGGSDDEGGEATRVFGNADGAATTDRQGMPPARVDVQAARRRCASTLRFAALFMSRPVSVMLFKGLVALPEPVIKAFNQEMVSSKTQRGSVDLHERLCRGDSIRVLQGVLDNFTSCSFAEAVGATAGAAKSREQTAQLAKVASAL